MMDGINACSKSFVRYDLSGKNGTERVFGIDHPLFKDNACIRIDNYHEDCQSNTCV